MNNNESVFRDDFSLAQELMQKARDTEDTEAVHLLDKAIDIFMRQYAEGRLYDEQIITQALIDRALHLSNLTRYDEALADYDRAIEIMERMFAEGKLHDESVFAMGRYVSANNFVNSGMYSRAVENYDRAIEIFQRLEAEGKLPDRSVLDDAIRRRDAALKELDGCWGYGSLP